MQPGQQKITQFDEVTSTQSGDVIPIVRGGQNKKISVENFTGVLPEGWLTPAEAWTFASFGNGVGVITIPEGNINRYPNGTRVWFKQGTPTATNRYGIVIASTTTTLTLAMIAGTTLQNLAIQQPAISSEAAPRTSENIDWVTFGRLTAKLGQTATEQQYASASGLKVEAGYGWSRNPGGSNNFASTVTFQTKFALPPVVIIGSLAEAVVDAATPPDFQNASGSYAQAAAITAEGFTARILNRDSTNLNTTARYAYSWVAIGV